MSPRRAPPAEVISPQNPLEGADPPDEDDEEEEDPFGDLGFLTNADDDITWGVERYKTSDEVRENPKGRSRVFVTTIDGPINLVAFQREHGGGVFRFFGKRGTLLIGSKRLELAGPRINYNLPATPAAAPAARAHVNGDHIPRPPRWARKLWKKLEGIETRLAQPNPTIATPPAPQTPPLETLFALADKIAARANPPQDPSEKLAEALLKGIDIGTAREPQPAGENGWVDVVKEIAPVLRDLLGAVTVAARTRGNVNPGAQRPRAAAAAADAKPMGTFDHIAEADVVEDPTVKPAGTPEPPQISYRWMTAIESLASAVMAGDDPQDFALTLERILDAQELFELKGQDADQVMKRLEPAGAMLPVLKTPEAKSFITAVLAELKSPAAE